MMQSPNELIAFLTRNQFLSPSQGETLNRDRQRFASAVQMCGDLVQRGWLTPYQQAQLLSGHGEKLIIGSYRLQAPIGEGGMGMVFKAIQPKLDRVVALKIIRPQVLAARPEILSRFHREARAIAQLNHPNVVILFDADDYNGTHYIAMEYVEGPTLEKLVRSQGPLAIRQACEYMRQAALGLQHAFEVGLVHRDIKPSNILVAQKTSGGTAQSSIRLSRPALVTARGPSSGSSMRLPVGWGTVKILDMGLARLTEGIDDSSPQHEYTPLTRAGALLGTPDFIAPEQARDARSVNIKADIYSLGCTLYYILTGKPPFTGGTDVQKLIRHQTERPFPIDELRPGISQEVVTILARMLEKRPEDRYPTPQAMADAFDHFLTPGAPGGTPVPTSPIAETPPVAETPIPGPGVSPVPANKFRSENIPMADPFTGPIDETGATKMLGTAPTREARAAITVSAHTGPVGAVAVSRDGSLVASAGIDGRARLWDVTGPAPREVGTLPRPGAEFHSITFSPKEDYIVAGGSLQGTARVWRWDFREGRAAEWGAYQGEKANVPALAFSPDGRRFAAAIGSFVVLWKVSGRKAGTGNVLKGHGRPVKALAFAPNGKRLVSAGEGGNVLIWGFGWFGPSIRIRFEGHTDIMNAVTVSPDGSRIATTGLDRNVIVWDAAKPRPESAFPLVGHNDNLRQARFLTNGQLLSVGESGHVILWDPATSMKVHEFKVPSTMTLSMAISNEGKRIICGSADGKVSIFDSIRIAEQTAVGV